MDVGALSSVLSALPLVDPGQSQSGTGSSTVPAATSTSNVLVADIGTDSTSPSATSSGGTKSAATNSNPLSPPLQPPDAAQKASKTNAPQAPSASLLSDVHVAYKFVTNPVQVVVVFTNATNGQEIAQVPPQFVVQLVKFDHSSGELVDRNA
ncbi:MAG TPA: hypothetical protein VN905_07270 [Candidatus Binatia bacterium]|nr:hypothetical protein [Candidatus Binatia bacterium]